MAAPFQVRTIEILWKNKDNVKKILNEQPLEHLKEVAVNRYSVETKAYNYGDERLAFELTEPTKVAPYLLKEDGQQFYLRKIIDPLTKKEYWIEDGKWSDESNTRLYETFRRAGTATVHFDSAQCDIHIQLSSFTKEQRQRYLDDFKNDFWQLILDPRSYVKEKVKSKTESIIFPEHLEHFERYLSSTEKIAENLKKELKEVQSLRDRKKVRPVPKTFLEIATKGYGRTYTSRDFIDSFDVPENQYILFTLSRVIFLLNKIVRVSSKLDAIYKSRLKSYRDQLDSFTTQRSIDKELVLNELDRIKNKTLSIEQDITNDESALALLIDGQNIEDLKTKYQDMTRQAGQDRSSSGIEFKHINLTFGFGARTKKEDRIQFFINYINEKECDHTTFLELDIKYFEGISLESKASYQISGLTKIYITETSGRQYHNYQFIRVKSITLKRGSKTYLLKKYKEKCADTVHEIETLEKDGWVRELSSDELKEQDKEKINFNTLINQSDELINTNSSLLRKSKPIIERLQKLQKNSLREA